MGQNRTRSDAQWRAELSKEQFDVLRRDGTEPPFSGAYADTGQPGVYRCVACGTELFSSRTKFDSRTGWPSFTAPAHRDSVRLRRQWMLFLPRTEVRCAGCDGHLGHVFGDGPGRGVKRYCINSVALDFEPAAPAD